MTVSRADSALPAAVDSAEPVPCEDATRAEVTGPSKAVFSDPRSRALARLLERIGPTDVPVLITGESGTGKEYLARYIHERSGQSGEFVVIQCGQLTHRGDEELAPWRGTTGRSRSGSSPQSARGRATLFFDDVEDLSPSQQCELLRVFRENDCAARARESAPLSRVRVIASSSVDLNEAAVAGRFRRDLFYRLNVASVKVLPLRQRPGDIAPLANHFLEVLSADGRLPVRVLGQGAISALRRYRWPGNVRELENVVRIALLTGTRREIGVEDLGIENEHNAARTMMEEPFQGSTESMQDQLAGILARLLQNPGTRLFDKVEELLVTEAFRATGGNQVHTATLLGISRNVVRTLLQKHGLLRPRRRHGRGT